MFVPLWFPIPSPPLNSRDPNEQPSADQQDRQRLHRHELRHAACACAADGDLLRRPRCCRSAARDDLRAMSNYHCKCGDKRCEGCGPNPVKETLSARGKHYEGPGGYAETAAT